ncbi:MAG: NUDIX domain-containing protein [Patescibacteria group bacterium]
MIHEDTFKEVDFNGAKGIVFLGDKMLVYRRDDKTSDSPLCLDLPGGGHEVSESPFATFQREVKEEFGLDIEGEEIEFSCTIPSVMTPEKKSFFIVAKVKNSGPEDIVFGNEGVEWFLMTPEEFIAHPDGIKRQQERVGQYLSGSLVSV